MYAVRPKKTSWPSRLRSSSCYVFPADLRPMIPKDQKSTAIGTTSTSSTIRRGDPLAALINSASSPATHLQPGNQACWRIALLEQVFPPDALQAARLVSPAALHCSAKQPCTPTSPTWPLAAPSTSYNPAQAKAHLTIHYRDVYYISDW